MARFSFEEAELQTIAAKLAPAIGWVRGQDINGNDIGYGEADDIVATDTTLADWTRDRGEPRREGDVWIFETEQAIYKASQPQRRFVEVTSVYVVEIPGGTAAYVVSP